VCQDNREIQGNQDNREIQVNQDNRECREIPDSQVKPDRREHLDREFHSHTELMGSF
jgi:hypothetical protein